MLLMVCCCSVFSQSKSQLLKQLRQHPQKDTFRVNRLNQLCFLSDVPPSLKDSFFNEAFSLSQKLNFTAGQALALTAKSLNAKVSEAPSISKQAIQLAVQSGDKTAMFWAYRSLGSALFNTSQSKDAIKVFKQAYAIAQSALNPKLIIYGQLAFVDYYKSIEINYPLALQWSLKALQVAEKYNDKEDMPIAYRNIGIIYLLLGDDNKSLVNLQKALLTSEAVGDMQTKMFVLNDLGEKYRVTGHYTEALNFYNQASALIKDSFNIELNKSNMADVYQRLHNNSLCFIYAYSALKSATQLKDSTGIAWIDNILSRAYLGTQHYDSAIYYGKQGYHYAVLTASTEYMRDNSEALYNIFNAIKNYQQALFYYSTYITLRDSMNNNEVTNKSNLAQFNYDLEKKQSEITSLNKDKQLQKINTQRQNYLLLALASGIILVLSTLIFIYRNNIQRRKAYRLLEIQKQEILLQRDQTNHALTELKSTQAQLIQSEKMASLGELTAGIAHEIQNPLNFVNNFSELNKELLEELKDEIDNGNMNEVKTIANDVIENEVKINHHGKRADAIVKGMLQHSRKNNGVKENIDINALCDEYVRLSYHGLRAKDKNFIADFKTYFDESIGKINIVPQDMGRVLLNLFNNAFYAVNEKKKTADKNYKPLVTVATKSPSPPVKKGWVEVIVTDNGNGIPQKVIDKIFQPFFTTKPTGEGTGLGLSLSYDIITKEHNGTIKVESKEGEGSTFIIQLPAT